jgi:hypothetical protein
MYSFVAIRGNVMSPSEIKLFITVRNILAEVLKYLTFFLILDRRTGNLM